MILQLEDFVLRAMNIVNPIFLINKLIEFLQHSN